MFELHFPSSSSFLYNFRYHRPQTFLVKRNNTSVYASYTHTHTNSVLDRPSTFQADVLTIKFSPTSFPQTEYCHSPFLHLRTRAHVFRPTTDVLIYIYIARDTFRHRNSNLIETSLISTTLDFTIV